MSSELLLVDSICESCLFLDIDQFTRWKIIDLRGTFVKRPTDLGEYVYKKEIPV